MVVHCLSAATAVMPSRGDAMNEGPHCRSADGEFGQNYLQHERHNGKELHPTVDHCIGTNEANHGNLRYSSGIDCSAYFG